MPDLYPRLRRRLRGGPRGPRSGGYPLCVLATSAASLSSAIVHPAAPGESAGMPTWVRTIRVRPPTVLELDPDLGGRGMPVGHAHAPRAPRRCRARRTSTRCRRAARCSTTSRYSPVNHICIGPSGVCTSMHTRRLPPTRTSICATGIVGAGRAVPRREVLGVGPHLPDELDRRVEGALDHHGVLGRCRQPSCSPVLRSRSELLEVVVHPVEAGLPHGPVLLGPRRDLFERRGVEGARPVLGRADRARPAPPARAP